MGRWRGIELTELRLATKRMVLRPLTAADAPAVLAATQDGSLHRFLHHLPMPYTEADAHAFTTEIAQQGRLDGTGLECGLEADGVLVGTVALRFPASRLYTAAEIGYAVYPGYRDRGYAAEGVRALASWGFQHGLERIEIRCQVDNLPSARVALAAGFRFEGVMRENVATRDGTADGAVFARCPSDSGARITPAAAPLPSGGLTDGVVRLRVQEPRDLDAVMDEVGDLEARRWEFTDAAPRRADWQDRLARAALDWLVGRVLRMSIIDEASDDVAGSMQIRVGGPPALGNVGYGMRPGFRGRGYTARALRLLTAWAFDAGGFARLELGAKADNVASQRAALAGGFQPDGVMVARLRNPDGTFSDEARFAAVSPRYRPAHTPDRQP